MARTPADRPTFRRIAEDAVSDRVSAASIAAASRKLWHTRHVAAPAWAAAGTAIATEATYLTGNVPLGLTAAAVTAAGTRLGACRIREDMRRARIAAAAVGGTWTGVILAATAGLSPHDFAHFPAGIPAWAFTAATFGAIHEWLDTEMVKDAKRLQRLLDAWPADREALGSPELSLTGHRIEMLATGRIYHLTAPRGRIAMRLIDVDRAAATWGVPREWVQVAENPRNPRRATLTVFTSDPWADVDNRHPAVTGGDGWETVSRSILDPQPIGVPATRAKASEAARYALLELVTDAGAEQVNYGGRKRSGKSTGINSLAASILSCSDALLCLIDIPKQGIEGKDWGPGAIEVCAGTFEAAELLLVALLALCRHRSVTRWAATRETPAVTLVIDELKSLLEPEMAKDAHWGPKLTGMLEALSRVCGAAGIPIVLGTQRPTEDAFGGSVTTREQANQGVCFALRKASDVPYVLGRETTVDISQWTEKGLFVGSSRFMRPDEVWRGFDLHEPADIQALGRRYAVGRPCIEPAGLAAMNEELAPHKVTWADLQYRGDAQPSAGTPLSAPADPEDDPPAGGQSAIDEEFAHMTDQFELRPEYAGMDRAQALARLRAVQAAANVPRQRFTEPPPIGDPAHMSPDELEVYTRLMSPEGEAWRRESAARYVPEPVRPEHAALLGLLAQAGESGARAADLAEALKVSGATVLRRLGELRDNDLVRSEGQTHHCRWLLAAAPATQTDAPH